MTSEWVPEGPMVRQANKFDKLTAWSRTMGWTTIHQQVTHNTESHTPPRNDIPFGTRQTWSFRPGQILHSTTKSFYWPNMQWDLEESYIPACPDCARNKGQTSKPAGPLHPLPVPDNRSDSVAINFISPLPIEQGYDCIMTMTEWLGADVTI